MHTASHGLDESGHHALVRVCRQNVAKTCWSDGLALHVERLLHNHVQCVQPRPLNKNDRAQTSDTIIGLSRHERSRKQSALLFPSHLPTYICRTRVW